MRITVIGTNKESIKDLINPKFPRVVKAEFSRPYANQTPCVKYNDADHDGVEHYFGRELKAFLDCPEAPDTNELGGNTNDEEVGQSKGVVGDDGVLEGGYYCYGCVQGVAEEEIA